MKSRYVEEIEWLWSHAPWLAIVTEAGLVEIKLRESMEKG